MSPVPITPLELRVPSHAAPSSSGRGLAIGRKGFRPFFLLASAYAAVSVPLWVIFLGGHMQMHSGLPPQTWHAHEMLFGYAGAVIAGFLLTAVGNWTKRETLVGLPLLGLALAWLLARIALLVPALPPAAVAAIDLAFLPALAASIARPIAQTGNRRNYVMIAVLFCLWLCNLSVHLDALGVAPGQGRRATLLALHLIVLLMLLISGRVVPMFTRNALADPSIRSIAALDRAALASVVGVAAADFIWGDTHATPWLCALAALCIAGRTRHWGTPAAFRDPMLWILHVGHAWIAVGFLLKALAPLTPGLAAGALHALTAGALGCLSLGMMARVTLGHTGRMIAASTGTRRAFLCMVAAGALRVVAPLAPSSYLALLGVSAALWALAFVSFLWEFAGPLAAPRRDGAPG